MKFPEKLWEIVNNCKSGAIGWSYTGDSIILDYEIFRFEFLNGTSTVFKTGNIASFVRQLNLYGFRKCNRVNEEVHEFKHPFFIKNRKELVHKIHRKLGSPSENESSFKKLSYPNGKNALKIPNGKANEVNKTSSIHHLPENSMTKKCKILVQQQSTEGNMILPFSKSTPSSSLPYHSYVQNGWLPADAEFYKFQTPKKERFDEEANKENHCIQPPRNDNESKCLDTNKDIYVFVVPGSALCQYPFSNPAFFRGLFHYAVYPLPGANTYSLK